LRAPRQYHFVNQTLNWTKAQRYCREHHTDLVTISDIQEQNDTEQAIKRVNSNADRVWIGLKKHESHYWKWGSKQPDGDGDCVYMEKDGQWHDLDCSQTRHFICYNGEFSCMFHV
uniref:C-type lectin domain-containing protein n=1 Tax=Cyprinus carpio TaxID=7962 RepID=A0A8C1YCG9_CYPCA